MISNPQRYPDPEGMTKAIQDLNMVDDFHLASVGNDTPWVHELDQ